MGLFQGGVRRALQGLLPSSHFQVKVWATHNERSEGGVIGLGKGSAITHKSLRIILSSQNCLGGVGQEMDSIGNKCLNTT